MIINRKLDDSYRVLIPVEIRTKLDIKKYEPVTLDFNEETKEITISFNKYSNNKVITPSVNKLPNPITIEPLESISIKLQVRKRNLVTIPNGIFKELNLHEKRYNVFCVTDLTGSTLTFNLAKNGTYKYRKENVLSFSEISNYFNLNIHEGIFCDFKYKSDGTLIFKFNPNDLIKKQKEEPQKIISSEERQVELNSKFMNDGLCEEEYNELNKLVDESKYDLLEELGPDVQHELEEYRKQLPKFKATDTIELKTLKDSIIVKPCPRCGETIVGDKTLKINGRLHCEECSNDFKNQLINDIKIKKRHKR